MISAGETLAALGSWLAALIVSTFPEQSKRRGWPAALASPAAHVVSGWLEAVASAALFVIGFLLYVGRFTGSAGWTYVSHRPALGYGDFFGVGALGYLSYLLTPAAWGSLYCFGEGIARSLDAALSGRMLGVAAVALPWRAVTAASAAWRRRRERRRLGPERPDEIVAWERGPLALTVFASRCKPWPHGQVIDYRGEFLRLLQVTEVWAGERKRLRYDFAWLQPGEVIHGVLIRYPDGTAGMERGGAPAGGGPHVSGPSAGEQRSCDGVGGAEEVRTPDL